MLLAMNAITATGQNNYEKVTSTPNDWTGEYLLVYEADATTAYSWTGVDAANCYEEMTINGNSISAPNAVTISIAEMEGGYSILVNGGTNNGKYIYGQSGSNTIKFGTSPEINTLECESDGIKITSFTSVMRFNSASNNLRFRYFKSTSYTNQQVVQLYKKNDGGQQQETVATPTFTPAEGTYYEPQSVSISCATEGSTICYTTDGSEPNENSAQFTAGVPLNISETTTVKAKAYKSGYTESATATATYTFPTLVTIAQAKALAVNEYAMVQGIVNFIDNRNVYVQDATGGICLFLNSNTVPSALALGDMVQAYGKRANYNGLFELSNINGGNESEFSILSSGNTLPLAVKTIAEVNEGGSDALQCMRVKIENATIGAINTGGNTPLTQGVNAINIYKVPSLTGIEEGDQVDVIGVIGYFNAAQIRVASADDITLLVTPDPVLNLSTTELNDFRYMLGEGPSAAKNFTISGSNLTGDVTMTAPANFELSILPSSGYFDSDELSPVNGTLNETTVYVRMKAGLEVGEYTGNINIVCGELSETITLTGTVTRQPSVLTANPTSLSGFTYEYEQGGPSEVASFLISGDHLTSNVAIYPSESFEVSTLPATLFRPENPAMVYIPNSGHFFDISISVRMKAGLDAGTYNERIYAVSEDTDTLFINVSGTVTGGQPTPPPTPVEGNYVRISDLSQLTEGAYVVFAARFDENASDYYAMTAATTGKPTGALFTSAMSGSDEVLPASIADEEASYYWIVGVTNDGYTFTNAAGELIGYSSGTNFATGGDNTEWSIELGSADEGAMVPSYSGFLITNVNNDVRHFALNSNHNFGPYHSNNFTNIGYNFYLDLFVKTEGGVPPTPVVATPTFTPEAGTYFEEQTVSIACATDGATIHYTLDGTDPTENSPVYSTPININETTTLKAIAMKEGYDNSAIAEATYTIQTGAVVIFNQDWEGEMNGWTFVSVEGEMNWTIATYQGNHYAYANGYSGGSTHANEDWCISPAFNLNAYSNPVLTFRTAKNYNGPDIEVFFSSDYNGTDPSAATWQELECALSTGSWTWTESGDIDLSAFNGSNCYIGFKYTCTDESAAGWEVDDIMLVGQTSEPVVTVTPLSLTGFTYVEGNGPSAEQSFTVSGLNLSSNIIIAAATDYEISLGSGNDFVAQTSLTLSHNNGTIEETSVYVRLKAGLAIGNYNDEDITITSADVDDIDVTCSGSVTAQPAPGGDYVRISDMSQLVAGNRIILATRYNETANAYLAAANTLTSGKLTTTEFTSTMNGSDETIPANIMDAEDSYYWTVDVTADGYTFTNANGDMIGYGNSGTNFVMNGNKTVWTISTGVSAPESLVPEHFGFNIVNFESNTRAMALRVTETESVLKAYSTGNMTGGEYNFFLDIFMQGEGGTPTVAAPTFEPAAGTYYEAQDVTLSCVTDGATIYYSLESVNGPWNEYEEAITVDESMTIWAYAEKEGCNDSPVVNAGYVIQTDLTIIFNQDWEEDWHGWTEVSVLGDTTHWTIAQHNGNHYAYMNAYQQGVNEDWLISPAFNLDSYSDVVLTFVTAKNYNGPDVEVYFSNDYDGEDPTEATWQEIECALSQGSWTWTESGEISLDGFNGTNCHIAFKYTSIETEAAGWEVDDILLVSGSAIPTPSLTATPNTINGLDYIEGEGPSDSQTYILTGNNLDCSEVTIHVQGEFRISLDEIDWTADTTVPVIDGQIAGQTIYVRMVEGLEMGTYEGTITHNCGEASAEVSLTGVVHSENVPSILWNDLPYYIQGNNGSNNNRVPVATFVLLQNLEPYTTYRYTNQFVDENDGPETAGAGNVIYANLEGFYRSTSPSLATEGGYGEFTTNWDGNAYVWFVNEPTANARFTPGNHVYLRIRLNDGHDGTTVAHTLTTESYATVINFGTEHGANQGSAFYVKSNESPMTFAQLFSGYMDPQNPDSRPIFSTIVETTGVDFGSINQYADFYKDEVAGKDGWFGGILPNDNEYGINKILVFDITHYWFQDYYTAEFNGHWNPDANTVNPTNGLNEPIFIDLTYDGIEETVETNVKVWSADHEFVIENGESTHFMMTVYNILGQPMMQRQINAGSTERISHSLAAGVYVIRMENNLNKVSVKVIVK